MIKIVAILGVLMLNFVLTMFTLRILQMSGYRIKECNINSVALCDRLACLTGIGGICAIVGMMDTRLGLILCALSAWIGAGIFFNQYRGFRTKVVFTKRASRLLAITMFVDWIVYLISAIFFVDNVLIILLYAGAMISELLIIPVAMLVNPLEQKNNNRYILQAKGKISKLDAIKIGITGSYGKTSCKNIVYHMLKDDFKVLKTDRNYNTPMGLALTSKKIVGNEEVFIAEMGARHIGDIAELCDIVHPTIGIITGIAPQHLDTFYNEYNIYKAKKELIDALPNSGFAVFNGDCSFCMDMYNDSQISKKCVSRLGFSDVFAEDIKLSNAGSNFKIVGIDEPFYVSTKLLGRHNITNILLCATVAHKLGVPASTIKEKINTLTPTKHRLELVATNNGITVIDDSYNCNIEGAKFALEVLALYSGRKIVMTQGIVEQGEMRAENNTKLGTLIAETANVGIVIGENRDYIIDGLLLANMNFDKIYTFTTLEEAQNQLPNILVAGDILLIQNDIP
ncbi:MAG: UDP-N-acetylmuramoyl-tripeptide--D-alanyl-D-alanine ligase [Bacillota bacterium]